jgi:hypothetical protein
MAKREDRGLRRRDQAHWIRRFNDAVADPSSRISRGDLHASRRRGGLAQHAEALRERNWSPEAAALFIEGHAALFGLIALLALIVLPLTVILMAAGIVAWLASGSESVGSLLYRIALGAGLFVVLLHLGALWWFHRRTDKRRRHYETRAAALSSSRESRGTSELTGKSAPS